MYRCRAMGTLVLAISLFLIVGARPAPAQLHGHGPDAWQVVDVAQGDVLNARMGPGVQYPIIGSFDADQTGLRQITCVPFMTYEMSMNLPRAERDRLNLPPRWCLMTDADNRAQGWVAGRYLAEAVDDEADPARRDPVETAVRLVERLYTVHEQALRGEALSPLNRPRARDFFFLDDMDRIATHPTQADPLYDAQDTEIAGLSIGPKPDRSMVQRMITVLATFTNFGQPTEVTFELRADTRQDGAPIRIMRIVHPDWTFP